MTRRELLGALLLCAVATGLAAGSGSADAAQIWSGRTFGFAKPAGGNPGLPANQDRITPLVWITRASSQGIFNIAQEPGYVRGVSPAGTEWAAGDAVHYASLTFTTWDGWSMSNPPSTVGVNAVVHLIAEDIYIDIVFDGWGGGASGGSFAYRRGLPPATPASRTSWGRIKTLYR